MKIPISQNVPPLTLNVGILYMFVTWERKSDPIFTVLKLALVQ